MTTLYKVKKLVGEVTLPGRLIKAGPLAGYREFEGSVQLLRATATHKGFSLASVATK